MVPAVFAAPTPQAGAAQGVDGATIRTDQIAHPEVYVEIRDEDELKVARFPEFTLPRVRTCDCGATTTRPGGWSTLPTGIGSWPKPASTKPGRRPCRRSRRLSAPGATAIDRAALQRRENPETSLVAYAGASRGDLLEGGRAVGSVSGQPSGNYELTIEDPGREIQQLRVVAFLEGALAASSLAAVTEGP